jgi:hypothetical protein
VRGGRSSRQMMARSANLDHSAMWSICFINNRDSARGRILAAMKRGKALARADRKRRRRAKASWSVDDDLLVLAVLRIVAAALAAR